MKTSELDTVIRLRYGRPALTMDYLDRLPRDVFYRVSGYYIITAVDIKMQSIPRVRAITRDRLMTFFHGQSPETYHAFFRDIDQALREYHEAGT